MKELEKTKRISIATTLLILIVIIALLAYKRPKHVYAINTVHTHEKLISNDYFVSLNDINNADFVLIDIRNQFEYEKGHLENAVNIPAAEILNDASIDVFNELKNQNKTAILYGSHPNEINAPFITLIQLGHQNIKMLTIENSYIQNKLISNNISIEKSEGDIKAFIDESIKKATKIKKQKVVVRKPKPKKVIKVKKKRKAPAEGGC